MGFIVFIFAQNLLLKKENTLYIRVKNERLDFLFEKEKVSGLVGKKSPPNIKGINMHINLTFFTTLQKQSLSH